MLKFFLWTTGGNVFSRALVFLSMLFMARSLGAEDFGKFSIYKGAIETIVVLGSFRFGVSLITSISQNKLPFSSLFKIFGKLLAIIAVIITIGVIVFSDFILSDLFKGAFDSKYILLILVGVLSGLFNIFFISCLTGLQHFKNLSINLIVTSLFYSLLIIGGTMYFGLLGCVIAFTLQSVLLITLNFKTLTSKNIIKKIFVSKNDYTKILKYTKKVSGPLYLSSLLDNPIVWLNNFVLLTFSDDFSNVGSISSILLLGSVIGTFNMALGQILLTVLSKNKINEGSGDININFLNLLLSTTISVMIVLPFLLNKKFFILMFGDLYSIESLHALLWVILSSYVLTSFRDNVIRLNIVAEKTTFVFFEQLLFGLSSILIMFLFIKDDIIMGRAWSMLLPFSLYFLIFIPMYINKKILKISLEEIKYMLVLLFVIVAAYFLSGKLSGFSQTIGLLIVLYSFIIIAFAHWGNIPLKLYLSIILERINKFSIMKVFKN